MKKLFEIKGFMDLLTLICIFVSFIDLLLYLFTDYVPSKNNIGFGLWCALYLFIIIKLDKRWNKYKEVKIDE